MTCVRRSAPAAGVALALLLLGGCGQATPDTFAVTPADAGALETCAGAVSEIAAARTAVTAGAPDAVAAAARSMQALAESTADDLLGQTLQEAVDSLTAFAAVASDPGLGAYDDVVADVRGRLAGFRRTCPVADPGLEHGASGWTALSATEVTDDVTGRTGAAVVLANPEEQSAEIGARAPAGWVARATGSAYRVGVWARAEAGTPTLSLTVTERSGRRVLGDGVRSVRLGPGWTFLGLTYPTSGKRGALTIELAATDVPAGAGVVLDDVSVARG